MKHLGLLLTFCLWASGLMAQQTYLQGTVTDASTGAPLPFVSLWLKNQERGTVTNDQGAFLLVGLKGPDSLVVSFLGYKPLRLPIIPSATGQTLSLKLSPTELMLDEVTLRDFQAADTLKKALSRVAFNHPDQPFNVEGFFRQLTVQRDTAARLSENVFFAYHRGFGPKGSKTELQIKESRNSKSRELVTLNVSGGPLAALEEDQFSPKTGLLNNPSMYKNLDWGLESLSELNGRKVYVVSSRPAEGKKIISQYTFYLEAGSLAFLGMDYEIPRNLAHQRAGYWRKSSTKRLARFGAQKDDTLRLVYEYIKISKRYQFHLGRWYPSDARTEIDFHLVLRKNNIKVPYQVRSQMAVTRLMPGEAKKIGWFNSYDPDDDVSKQASDYRPDFWKNYNIITPTPAEQTHIDMLRKLGAMP